MLLSSVFYLRLAQSLRFVLGTPTLLWGARQTPRVLLKQPRTHSTDDA